MRKVQGAAKEAGKDAEILCVLCQYALKRRHSTEWLNIRGVAT